MKYFLIALLFGTLFALNVNGQIENPVRWSFISKKISAKQYELHMTAEISGNWHIYSQDAGIGPEPTSFSFSKNPIVKLDGKVLEVGKLEKAYDPNFKSTLKFYNHKVDFVQKVTVRSAASTIINGTLLYMVCNDNKCLPPKELPFSFKLSGK